MRDYREDEVLEFIKGLRQDIKTIDREAYHERQKAAIRVHAWNWLTDPAMPMTDKEHDVCRKFARRIMKQLKPLSKYWHESDSGRLWIVK